MQKCILRGCNDNTSTSSLFIAFHSRWISITLHINILLFILLAITSQADANRNSQYYFKWQRLFRRNRPQKIQTNNLNNLQEIIFFLFSLFSLLSITKLYLFNIWQPQNVTNEHNEYSRLPFLNGYHSIVLNQNSSFFSVHISSSFFFVFSWIRCFIHSLFVERHISCPQLQIVSFYCQVSLRQFFSFIFFFFHL